MVTVVGNGHDDPSSNPERNYLWERYESIYYETIFGKDMNPIIPPQAIGK